MFWQTKPAEDNSLDLLLKSDDISLADVLNDPFTLQEIRNQNKTLIEYLTREDVLMKMMQTALKPDIDPALPLKEQYKHSHICSEILSLNSEELCDAVIASKTVLAVVSEFMGNNCQVNHLVASFYMKIVCQLLSRNSEKMMEVLKKGCFVDRCIENLHLSAVSELVYRLVSIPYDYDMGIKIRQWYVDNGLVESSVSLLDPSFPSAAHDNVAYLWTELVKVLREVLYTSEEKFDPLLEKMQSSEVIEALLNKVIKLGSCEGVCESVIVNVCHIIITLLESNFIPNCPSHQLADDKGDLNWTGGVSDNPNTLDGHEVWLPDPERVVELTAAKYAADLLRMTIDEIKRDDRGDSWLAMLQLLVQLCNTMHIPTHKLLYEAFKKENLGQLFSLVWERPQMSCFHKLLHKMVTYILYTASVEESPLLAYLFKELDIVSVLWKGMRPQCTVPRVSLICLRSFHCNLADSLEKARSRSVNKERINSGLKSSSKWAQVNEQLQLYNEWNRPIEVSSPSEDSFLEGVRRMSSNDKENDDDFFGGNTATQCLQLAQHSLREFDMAAPSQHLPSFESVDSNKCSKAAVDEIFEIDTRFHCNPVANLEGVGVDEGEFERLCTLRSSQEFDFRKVKDEDDWPGNNDKNESADWPNSSGTRTDLFDDWPEVGKGEEKDTSFPVQWNTLKKENGDDSTFENGNPSSNDDLWADFNSLKFDMSKRPAVINKDLDEDEWPTPTKENPTHDSSEDPVMVGFASGMMAGSSDC